ncbi:MAG: hypothetical protein AAFZ15_07530 [Bacteroidota bacterium]
MKTNNERFKVILTNAKLISLSKFKLVKAANGATNPEIAALTKEIDTVLAHFDNPEIWTHPLDFDEAKIAGFVSDIDGVDPKNLTKFASDVRSFITYLDGEVLKVPLANAETTDITDFNAKVLNALSQTQQKIGGRKKFFKNNGIDLDSNPAFQTLSQQQNTALTTYRQALRDNKVSSKQTDVLVFQMLGNSIQVATELAPFLGLFEKLTTTIQGKLPAA